MLLLFGSPITEAWSIAQKVKLVLSFLSPGHPELTTCIVASEEWNEAGTCHSIIELEPMKALSNVFGSEPAEVTN